MSLYSKKQETFAIYLLNQFGIDDEQFISDFLVSYAYAYGQYVDYPSGRYFSTSESISELILEKDIRKNRLHIKNKLIKSNTISATEIANYVFCPASYVINKSFEIDHPTGEKQRLMGEKLHDQLNLIKLIHDYKNLNTGGNTIFNHPLINKIYNSKIIYNGHGKEMTRNVFFNRENNIACDPDYIFLDNENNYFIVEEKFHYKKDPTLDKEFYMKGYNGPFIKDAEKTSEEWENSKSIFFKNHQIQLLTYLKNIKEYNSNYGYLIYWYYDFKLEEPYIHKVDIKKISLDDFNESFYKNTIKNFTLLLTEKAQEFQVNEINPNKCARCVVNKYCGHKNKKYDNLNFPYDLEYLKFYHTEYPAELIKPSP